MYGIERIWICYILHIHGASFPQPAQQTQAKTKKNPFYTQKVYFDGDTNCCMEQFSPILSDYCACSVFCSDKITSKILTFAKGSFSLFIILLGRDLNN